MRKVAYDELIISLQDLAKVWEGECHGSYIANWTLENLTEQLEEIIGKLVQVGDLRDPPHEDRLMELRTEMASYAIDFVAGSAHLFAERPSNGG